MPTKFALTAVTALLTIFSTPLFAVAGEVSSDDCPYSCSTEGYSKDLCRDWRQGDTCYIEVSEDPTNDDAECRPCPYSCSTIGDTGDACRDWRKGDLCCVDQG